MALSMAALVEQLTTALSNKEEELVSLEHEKESDHGAE